jgi:myosin heavy chain 9/10/11/14
MQPSSINNSPRRANPFGRHSPSPSPSPQVPPSRPKSAVFPPTFGDIEKKSHTRNSSSLSHFTAVTPGLDNRQRSGSLRQNVRSSGTFAPQFIKSEELQRANNSIHNLEGDNDFSGKRYVWLKDAEKAFVRGEVIEERSDGNLLVRCDDGSVSGTASTF